MSTISDIVVKKADGTTNVTFVTVTRSSGDNSPARWWQSTGHPVPANRPVLAIASSTQKAATPVRKLRIDGQYPIVLSDGTRRYVTLKGCEVLVPMDCDAVEVSEGVHQLLNAVSTTAVKTWCIEGNAPN